MRHVKVAVAVSMALIVVVGWKPFQKFRLDREVDRLCAIDGGVHIYETVTLPKENFGPDGEVFPQFRHLFKQGGHLGPDFKSTLSREVLVAGDPQLVKSQIQILRTSDGKLLGQQINYARGGGDLPGPWNPSTHQCRQVIYSTTPLRNIFMKGN